MDDVLATVEVRRRRFTIEEYYRMGEVGILGPEDRVELIEGEIVEMSPIGPRHATCVTALTRRLLQAVGDRAVPCRRIPYACCRTRSRNPTWCCCARPRHGTGSTERSRPTRCSSWR